MNLILPSVCENTSATYFDFDAALDRCCGDEDFLAEMIDLLGTSVATQLGTVEAAIASQSALDLDASAHALKGAVSSMTASRPYQLARDLEMLGKSGTCDHAEFILAELRVSLDQLLAETQQWVSQRAAL